MRVSTRGVDNCVTVYYSGFHHDKIVQHLSSSTAYSAEKLQLCMHVKGGRPLLPFGQEVTVPVLGKQDHSDAPHLACRGSPGQATVDPSSQVTKGESQATETAF